MEKQNYITMNGASFNEAHVLSFSTEKEFVAAHVNVINFLSEKEAKILLRSIYKTALKNKK